MLGWDILVFRKLNEGESPATLESPEGKILAAWETGLSGLDWIDELVKAGKAIDLGGGGYPSRYTATAKNLIPRILAGAPEARFGRFAARFEIVEGKSRGTTAVDPAEIADCRPDEWLVVEAWDAS